MVTQPVLAPSHLPAKIPLEQMSMRIAIRGRPRMCRPAAVPIASAAAVLAFYVALCAGEDRRAEPPAEPPEPVESSARPRVPADVRPEPRREMEKGKVPPTYWRVGSSSMNRKALFSSRLRQFWLMAGNDENGASFRSLLSLREDLPSSHRPGTGFPD